MTKRYICTWRFCRIYISFQVSTLLGKQLENSMNLCFKQQKQNHFTGYSIQKIKEVFQESKVVLFLTSQHNVVTHC
jgi:hypothetical protein